MIPISVASTFLTISWNASQSLNKDLELTVERREGEAWTEGRRFSRLDGGHKINSYTISDLDPSRQYRYCHT